MMNIAIINLKIFFEQQNKLDELILKEHGLTWEETQFDRLTALLTEIGELSNEFKSFKFWQQKKEIDREKVIEEYIDCFHFALSLAHYFPKHLNEFSIILSQEPPTLLDLYQFAAEISFKNEYSYHKFIIKFLTFGFETLKLTETNLKEAYQKKMMINQKRQKEKY